MISKKIIFLSCVLLIFLSIGNISAVDVNNTVQTSSVNLDEIITSNEINEQHVLSIGDENDIYGNSFNELQDLIDNAQGELNLTNDYSLGFAGGSIKILKNITIDGKGHTINGKNNGRIFSIETDGISVILKNIKFKNGRSNNGAAILNNHGSTSLTLINCNFDKNSAVSNFGPFGGYGGAIYSLGELTIIDSKFDSNHAYNAGAAIYCSNNILVDNTHFVYNIISNLYDLSQSVGSGSAIHCTENGDCTIINSNFKNNEIFYENSTLFGYGGAVYCQNNVFVNNTIFTKNNANSGGGAISCRGNIYGYFSKFNENYAESSGGAIFAGGEAHFISSEFNNNKLKFGSLVGLFDSIYGGAIYSNMCYIDSCIFKDNKASLILNVQSGGGAIYTNNALIKDSIFSHNTAGFEGGAVYSKNQITFINSSFSDNAAMNGGAVYIEDKCNSEFVSCSFEKNRCTVDGGAIYSYSKDSNLKIFSCSFFNNTAKNIIGPRNFGGAICSEGLIDIEESIFENNSAYNLGGAVYAKEVTRIKSSIFKNNSAKEGGAIHTTTITGEVLDSSFSKNKATSDSGGAIYLSLSNNNLILSYCSFNSNSAHVDGGAIYSEGRSIISNSSFIGNTAAGAIIERSFGGAIFSNVIEIEGSLFESNSAYNLGGAVYADAIKIKSSTFISNSAKEGGAVYTNKIGEKVTGSLFFKNSASLKGDGGAIYINEECNPEFVTCRFEYNTAPNRGGAIYLDSKSSRLKVSYCTFVGNHADKVDYKDKKILWITYHCYAGHSIFNKGYYDLIDRCWFGTNNPNFKEEQLVEYKTVADDIKHEDSNYLNIAMDINEKDLYVGNPYRTTVYFQDVGGNRLNNDLFHSMGSFYGDGIFKELNNGWNDMIAEVVFTNNTPTIYGKLDNQVVNLTLTAKNKEKSEVKIKCRDVTYPDNVVVDYSIINMADNAKYVVKNSEDEIVKQGSVSNPKGQIIIENLDSGSYSVTITNPETYNTLSSNATANFNVLKACASVNITVDDVVYGTPSNIKINSNVDGKYTVNVNGSLFTIQVTNGVGNKSVEFDAGAYYANVSMDNNNYYTNANTTFSVLKADIDLFIDIYDEVYPHDVDGIVYASVDGEYNLTVGLYQSRIVVVKNNWAYINLGVLDAGTYDAVISFAGNENYNPTSSKTTFNVNASGTFFEIKINPDEFIYGESATVTHKLSDGATGTIKYYLNNVTLLDELPVGENLTLPILDAGNYIIVANYSGDIDFKSSIDFLSFTVNPAVNNVVLNVSDVTYGDDTLFEVSADVDGNYTVNINGTNIIVNVLNGKGNKTIALDAGRYYANVTFNNKNYNTKSRNAMFNVFKADIGLIIHVFDEVYPQDVECVVFASRDGEYNLTIASYSAVITVNNNLAYVNIGVLDAGTYDAVVSFAGDNNYNSALVKTTFDVYPSGTLFEVEVNPGEISYGETAIVTHTLSDGATGTIKYYLSNGTFIDELPVGEDLILPILDAGSYVVIANYSGDDDFLPAFDSAFITVNPAPNRVNVSATNVTYGENTTIEVSADVDGIYQLDVNGIIYNVTVNNGFGSKIISLNAGSYYANASFADSNYDTVSKNADFNVYKAVNNLDIVIFDTVYSDDVSGFVHAEVDGEYNLTVGEYLTTVVVKNGKGEFNAGILDAGEYLVVVNYPGDLNYEANSYSTNVTVSKFVPNIKLQVNDFDYGDVGVITITSDIPGSVNVTVNGITEILDLNGQSKDLLLASMSNILKGEYQATLRLNNLNAGLYPVTVVYNGDGNIESVELSADFNVNALNVTMDINAADINVGDDELITVSFSSDLNGTVTVVVDDMNYSSSVSGGKAVITIPGLSAGYKNAVVYYSGDVNHNPILGNVSFAVNKLNPNMSVESNTPVSGENIHIVVYLPSDATGTVTLALEGKYYTALVKDGKAVFDISGLAAGKYNITAYYSGDNKYDPAQIDSIITVNDNSTNQENQTEPNNKLSSSSNKAVKATDKAAGNPILMLLLTLMAIGFTGIRRFKK